MKIEALTPFTYRWPGGELRLEPGKPIDLDNDRAQRLLDRGKVRVLPDVTVEPGTDRPVHWEDSHGVIHQGTVELFGMTCEADGRQRFWVYVGDRWIHESRLRSRHEYEAQSPLTENLEAEAANFSAHCAATLLLGARLGRN
jgi:hypothetical protein